MVAHQVAFEFSKRVPARAQFEVEKTKIRPRQHNDCRASCREARRASRGAIWSWGCSRRVTSLRSWGDMASISVSLATRASTGESTSAERRSNLQDTSENIIVVLIVAKVALGVLEEKMQKQVPLPRPLGGFQHPRRPGAFYGLPAHAWVGAPAEQA